MIAPTHIEDGVAWEGLACLFDFPVANIHKPCENERLGPCPALNKAAFHKQLIDANLGHFGAMRCARCDSKWAGRG